MHLKNSSGLGLRIGITVYSVVTPRSNLIDRPWHRTRSRSILGFLSCICIIGPQHSRNPGLHWFLDFSPLVRSPDGFFPLFNINSTILEVELRLCTSLVSNFLPLAGPPDDLFTFLAIFSPKFAVVSDLACAFLLDCMGIVVLDNVSLLNLTF